MIGIGMWLAAASLASGTALVCAAPCRGAGAAWIELVAGVLLAAGLAALGVLLSAP